MIIISQDKSTIVNFDNVEIIWIDDNVLDKTEPMFRICADTGNTGIALGDYETEERAAEVLEEIWKFYEKSKRHECSSNNGITIFLEPKLAYEMPKE